VGEGVAAIVVIADVPHLADIGIAGTAKEDALIDKILPHQQPKGSISTHNTSPEVGEKRIAMCVSDASNAMLLSKGYAMMVYVRFPITLSTHIVYLCM
jgi:hypothetical protein